MIERLQPERMKPDGVATVTDSSLSESTVESVALNWLRALGWSVQRGPDIAPDLRTLIFLTFLVMIGARLCGLLSHAWPGPPESPFQ